MTGSDINGKYAAQWSNADVSQIWASSSPQNTEQLFKDVRESMIQHIKLLCPGKNDNAYRNIADLVMLRINAALASFRLSLQQNDADVNSITGDICAQLDAALNEKYASMQACTVKDAANAVVSIIQDIILPQQDQHGAEQDTFEEDTKQTDAYSDAANSADDIPDVLNHVDEQQQKAVQSQDTSFTQIELNASAHVSKLSELCLGNVDYMQLKHNASLVKRQQETGVKAYENRSISFAKQKKTVQLSTQYAEQDSKKTAQRLPDSISKSNIYKYSGSMFQRMSLRNVMFTFAVVSAFKKRTEATLPCIKSFKRCSASNFANASEKVQSIYDSLPKSLFERIVDYIKGKFISQILSPLKKRLVDFLVKQFMPEWMQKLIGACQQFLKPVIDKFIAKAQSLGQRISRALKVVSMLLMKIAKPAFELFKLTFKGVVALIQLTLKLTFKALMLALRFAAATLRIICKFIYAGIKFIGKLFSKTGVGKFIGRLAGKVRSAVKNVAKGIQKVGQKIGNAFSKMKNAVKNGLKKLKGALKNGAKKVVKAIKNVIKKVAKKIFNVVKSTIKKAAQKIMKKLGLNIAKKVAKKHAQSLLKIGAKKIFGFFKKWVAKIIQKLATKILGMAAVNAVPILGQIISVGMMIYTIVDTIYTFYQVYKFMKEEPAAWDYMKEEVAKWAAKTFNFINDLLAAGKRWFYKVFIEGPKKLAKKVAHFCNFLVSPLAAAEKMLKNAAYARELYAIRDRNLAALDAMDDEKRAKFLKDNTKSNLAEVDKLRPAAEKLTLKIEKEQSSWWPSNRKIIGWIDERQSLYRQMMDFASKVGLSSFSSDVCRDAFDVVDEYEKKQQLAEQIARRNDALKLRYENKRVDLEELQKICKDLQSRTDAIDDGIRDLEKDVEQRSVKLMTELEELSEDEPEDSDETYVVAG